MYRVYWCVRNYCIHGIRQCGLTSRDDVARISQKKIVRTLTKKQLLTDKTNEKWKLTVLICCDTVCRDGVQKVF